MTCKGDPDAYIGGGQAHMSQSTLSSGDGAEGLPSPPGAEAPRRPAASTSQGLTNGNGLRIGAGRANGGGFTNGSGRTNGGGFTNGSGRTNGGGFTNGSGRTNGGGFTNGSGRGGGTALSASSSRTNGGRFQARDALALRRRLRAARRRRTQALAAGLLLTLTALTAYALASEAGNAARVDGRFLEWEGRTFACAGGGAVGLQLAGFQPGRLSPEMYLEFAGAPFASREDVWIFFDLDGEGATGYWTGAMGAEAAVRLSGDAGRLAGATAFAFSGGDRFDLGSLTSRGRVPAALDGLRVEFQTPEGARAFEVARADASAAASTGALTPGGESASFLLRAAPLTLEIRNGIRIDGQFSDWTGITRVSDPTDGALPGRLDLLDAAAVGDLSSAEFLVDVRGGVMQGTLPLRAEPIGSEGGGSLTPAAPARRTSGTDELAIYLDTDGDALTGAPFAAIGAERLLRVEGVGGVVVAADFFEFKDGAWVPSAFRAEAAAGGASLEAAVDEAGLVGARVRFTLTGFEGVSDINHEPVEVARQAGALGHPLGGSTSPAQSGSAPQVTPIPEFSDAAAVAGVVGLLALTVGTRRRKAP